MLQVDHFFARRLRIGQRHARIASEVAPLGTLSAQCFQRANATFVAGAPGLDALADPHFFLRQFLVEQRVGL